MFNFIENALAQTAPATVVLAPSSNRKLVQLKKSLDVLSDVNGRDSLLCQ